MPKLHWTTKNLHATFEGTAEEIAETLKLLWLSGPKPEPEEVETVKLAREVFERRGVGIEIRSEGMPEPEPAEKRKAEPVKRWQKRFFKCPRCNNRQATVGLPNAVAPFCCGGKMAEAK